MQTQITEVLDQLHDTTHAQGDQGEPVSIAACAVPRQGGEVIERAVRACAARTVLEVGCASAKSTLYLARGMSGAHLRSGSLRVIDPKQKSHWHNVGRRALRRAGLESVVVFYEQPAHVVLPRLHAEGLGVQFVFIDGWHMLDYVVVESFYSDLMLPIGGVIAYHDLWMPALQHFTSFWCANRCYEPVRLESAELTSGLAQDTSEQPRKYTNAIPYFVKHIAPFVDRGILLLRKISEDRRRWDFFQDYIAHESSIS